MTFNYNNYEKILFTMVLILVQIAFFSTVYAQKSVRSEESVKVDADAFYKTYLPQFGYPSAAELQKLRPFLSESLYSSLSYERERMKIWTAKHPGEKPPVSEDLFVCNHDEPPAKFWMGEITVNGQTALAIVYFDYVEKGKIYETCQTKSALVREGGKWLLDNVFFEEGADLKSLLSRKDYEVLP